MLKLKQNIQDQHSFILKLGINMTLESTTEAIRERSGTVEIDSLLVSVLYELMRDYVPPGIIEGIVKKSVHDTKVIYTNGWLAKYAEDLALRLTQK